MNNVIGIDGSMFEPFSPFPKIPRLSRECIITEKIDGTNASIQVNADMTDLRVYSRKREITPADDNFCFARWAYENSMELLKLGPGFHFGEWWGSGINRGYGLERGDKRWSLFNVHRWAEGVPDVPGLGVVPVLATGPFDTDVIEDRLAFLEVEGSHAAPGFMDPEGIVVFHTAGNYLFKKTFGKDGVH